eukprot:Em0014g207a
MDKSASCKIFGEYVDSLFPIGGKRSRSAVIRQDFAKRIVDHLKGKQDPYASFRHFVKKGGFALLDMPSAGIRDVLVVSLKEEKQNLNDRTMMKASRRVATVEEFYSILEQVHSKDCLHAGSTKTFAKVQSLYSHVPRSVVEHFIKLCETCSLRVPQKTKPPLRPIVANGFFSRVQIDLIDMRHLPHDGNKWILHIVDHWSKFNLAYPLPQKTAKKVTNALENHLARSCTASEWSAATSSIATPGGTSSLYTLERMMSSRIAETASNSPPWTHWLPHIVYTINAEVHSSTKHTPFELVIGKSPRSVVVPDTRLKGLINEEDLELTGEMESAQDTSDVDRTTELTLQHNSATSIQHSSLDSTHDSSPTVLDTVQHSSPSIHDSIHDSAPTVLDNIHHSPPSVKESMFDSSPTLCDVIQHSSCSHTIFNNSQDVTSNDSNTNSKLGDGVSRCCNSESETEEKDKTLQILDSEAKTEDQFVGRQKQLETIEKHRLVREKADMNYMKTALKMQEKFSKMHKVREFRVGEHVSFRIPRIDRSCTDLLRLPCIVVEEKQNIYCSNHCHKGNPCKNRGPPEEISEIEKGNRVPGWITGYPVDQPGARLINRRPVDQRDKLIIGTEQIHNQPNSLHFTSLASRFLSSVACAAAPAVTPASDIMFEFSGEVTDMSQAAVFPRAQLEMRTSAGREWL